MTHTEGWSPLPTFLLTTPHTTGMEGMWPKKAVRSWSVCAHVVGRRHKLLCSVMSRLAGPSVWPVLPLWPQLYLYPFKTQIGLLASESRQGQSAASSWLSFMWRSRASSQHSDVLVRSSSFRGLEAGMISVWSKWADPSCRACFDQTQPLAWQIRSGGSFVNAQASKQAHKTRCGKRKNLSDQTLINRHNGRKWGGFEVAKCGPGEERVEPCLQTLPL